MSSAQAGARDRLRSRAEGLSIAELPLNIALHGPGSRLGTSLALCGEMTTCIDPKLRCLLTPESRAMLRACNGAAPASSARVAESGAALDIDTARTLSAVCGYRVRGLAERLGVTPRHLRRLFTRQLGCPPERWLREERLRVAGQLLLTTGVKQVAFALAFRNESQFSRDFRAHFDCTPSQWAERGGAAPGATDAE